MAKGKSPFTKNQDPRVKKCFFTENDVDLIDYKNVPMLRKFLTYYAKIKPKYYTGTTLKNQKKLAQAVKRARYMGLLPFCR